MYFERGKRREKERERNIDWLPPTRPPTRGLACNPGMCPEWELNWRPFSSQDCTEPTEPYHPGPL